MTRSMLLNKTVFAVLFSLSVFNINAQTLYYPDTAWQVKKPEELKMNAALMMVAKPGTAVKTCLEDMDKKYKSIGGEKVEITRKMVDVLKKRKDSECNLMLALMRIELEKQEKGKK